MTDVGSGDDNVTLSIKLERQDNQLIAALVTDIILLGLVIVLFYVLHSRFRDFFFINPYRRGRGPRPPEGAFGWVRFVLTISEKDVERYAGLDALVFLIFLRMCQRILITFSVSFGLLQFALNIGCSFAIGDEFFPSGWSGRMSIANFPKTSQEEECTYSVLAVNAFCMVGLTVITLYNLRRGWLNVLEARHRYMVEARDAASRVVLVMNSPMAPVHSKEEALKLWRELYPDNVLDVIMIRDSGNLHKLMPKREHLKTAVQEEAWARPGILSCKSEPYDPLNLTPAQTKKRDKILASALAVDSKMAKELQQYANEGSDCGRHYFVLFSSLRAANLAKQAVHTSGENMQVHLAPLPTDVRHETLQPHASKMIIGARQTSRALYTAMLFFFIIPITAISSILTVSQLEQTTPFVKDILDFLGEEITAIVTAILPTLALTIFFAILPLICLILSKSEGWYSMSLVTSKAFEKVFFFQFIWGFIGMALTSSLLTTIDSIIDDPTGTLNQIGGAIASTSDFFTCYLMLQAVVAIPVSEMKIGPMLIDASKKLLAKKKAASARSTTSPQSKSEEVAMPKVAPLDPKYHVWWSKAMMGFTLGLNFANIHLLTTLVAIFFLFMCIVVYSNKVLFFYTNQHESCGRAYWATASQWVISILFTSQLLLFAVHAIKESFGTSVVALLCCVLTLIGNQHIKSNFQQQLTVLPLLYSVRADASISRGETSLVSDEERKYFKILYGAEFGAGLNDEGQKMTTDELVRQFYQLYGQKELLWPKDLERATGAPSVMTA